MSQSENSFLDALVPADFLLIKDHLQSVELMHQATIYRLGDRMERVYFPKSGVLSLILRLANGNTTEVAMVGRDGVVGGCAGFGVAHSLNEVTVQIPGVAYTLDGAILRAAADVPSFRGALFRYEQLVLLQAQQSAACNLNHLIERRLARWLLRSQYLAATKDLPLTQEFLSQMLGVRRTSVTLGAAELQKVGLIKYRRGHIQITDREGLRDMACECHEAILANSKNLLQIPEQTRPPS